MYPWPECGTRSFSSLNQQFDSGARYVTAHVQRVIDLSPGCHMTAAHHHYQGGVQSAGLAYSRKSLQKHGKYSSALEEL